MSKVIAIANQKGGVGKITITEEIIVLFNKMDLLNQVNLLTKHMRY